MGLTEVRRITVQGQPGQIVLKTLSQKYATQKSTSRMIQVVEHLSSKHRALLVEM
jgi:hypothetical protein